MNDSELEQLWYNTKFTPQLIKQLVTLNPDYLFFLPKNLMTGEILSYVLRSKPEFDTAESHNTLGDIATYFEEGDPESGIEHYYPHLKNDQNVIDSFKSYFKSYFISEEVSRIKKLSGL